MNVKDARHARRQKLAEKLKLTDAEIHEYEEAFALFDKDDNGLIDKEEVATAMRRLQLNPDSKIINNSLADMDIDGNGYVDFVEFVRVVHEQKKYCYSNEDIIEAFNVFDQDKNGFITVDELMRILTGLGDKLSKKEAQEMIKQFDLDKDGVVNLKEFGDMICDINKDKEKSCKKSKPTTTTTTTKNKTKPKAGKKS